MSEHADILSDTAEKLFSKLATKAVLDAADAGTFPQALWQGMEEAGFPSMLAAEDVGGIEATPADAVAVLRMAGRYSVPAPLAETMIARWLMSQAKLSIEPQPLALALGPTAKTWRFKGRGKSAKLSGTEYGVPWGSYAQAVAVLAGKASGSTVGIVESSHFQIEAKRNIAGEPRDRLSAEGVAPSQSAQLPDLTWDRVFCTAALFRAALIVGALEQILDLSVGYVKDRVQFGRPLSRWQAIQQQLAVLAGAVAAASAITDAAACVVDRSDGKLMVAVARARLADAIDTATGIAHQVHGAIGFAREYALHFSTRRLWAWRDEYGAAVDWREHVGRSFAGTPADDLWPALAAAGARTAD